MAVKKRVSKTRKVHAGGKHKLPDVSLATENSDPMSLITDMVMWFYGEPGVGKTTFTAEIPDTHHFMFENGAKFLSARQRRVRSWPEWLAYVEKFLTSKYKHATVDVVEDAYSMCFEWTCQKVLFIEHPADEEDYGKSWGEINKQFMEPMNRLMNSGKGVSFVSHAVSKGFTSFVGEKHDLIRPNLTGKILNLMEGKVDLIGYIYADGEQRKMQIRPDGIAMAKVRSPEHFLTPKKNSYREIVLGKSAKEGYATFEKAFNGKYIPPIEKKRALRRKSDD